MNFYGSTMETLIIRMFTMTGHHSKFHLSDLLLIIAIYFGDATLFSLTRHFDRCQEPGTRPKNSLMSLYVTCKSSVAYFGVEKECFPFFYLKRHVSLRFLIDRRMTRRITFLALVF